MNTQPANTAHALAMQAQGRMAAPSSDATLVEQQRAIAQVQGALVVAQQRPRDTIRAAERMRDACEIQSLAEHAFFRFSRGGGQVSGETIHLATELARCWGNVDYGVSELRRDDFKGESEMLAYAWDLETNTRVTNTFIVPHKRDKKGGPEALTDMRDIYENNANNGARRLRECIFRVLPKSFREEAKTICAHTLQHGGGEPIEQRRERLLKAFAALGVKRKQIEMKIGRPADQLTALDIGTLRVIYGSIQRGEIVAADEFPPLADDDTAKALAAQANAAKSAAPPSDPEVEPVEVTEDRGEQVQAQDAAAEADDGSIEPTADTAAYWIERLNQGITKEAVESTFTLWMQDRYATFSQADRKLVTTAKNRRIFSLAEQE